MPTNQTPDEFRAESYGQDAINWIRSVKRLATAQRNGKRVANVTIRQSENEAQLAARAAGRFALRALEAK